MMILLSESLENASGTIATSIGVCWHCVEFGGVDTWEGRVCKKIF